MRKFLTASLFVFVCSFALGAAGSAMTVVSQKNRAFWPKQIEIARGDTVTFTNDDEYLHQIYIDSSSLKVDSDEQNPGQDLDVDFPSAGKFEVRCGIHPTMVLAVVVK